MFNINYLKAEPTTYVLQHRGGELVREGARLTFWYYAPRNTIALIPLTSQTAGFMLELVTNDFQTVTVQGEVTFKVDEPSQIASLMDFSLDNNRREQGGDILIAGTPE